MTVADSSRSGRSYDSYEDYVRARWTHVLRLSCLLIPMHLDPEDHAQTALVKLASRWSNVDDPDAFVRRVLVNQRTDAWRRRRSADAPVGPPVGRPSESSSQPSHEEALIERLALQQALEALPRRQRQAVVLRYVEDLSVEESASVMHISQGSVKTHASRGLASLRSSALDHHSPENQHA